MLHFFVATLLCFKSIFALFLRVETGHQNIAIEGRDPYYGHFTKIHFHNLTCIQAIDVNCLKELTGAEEIDLLYSECPRGNWQVAHYTNSKHHFRLKQPVQALRLLISSRKEISIIDAQVESCPTNHSRPVVDCHHPSRGHAHRHGGKAGSLLKALDPSLSLDFEDIETASGSHRRYKRSLPEVNKTISSGELTITEDLIVPRGSVLTILPGANLKFAPNVAILVNGKLHLNGSQNQPIIMSPNEPGRSWNGVRFEDAEPGSILSNAKISGSRVAVDVDGGAAPYMEHLFLHGNGEGVKINGIESSSTTHLYKVNSVSNLNHGINHQGKGSLSIDTCVLASNGKSGIFSNSSDSKIVIRRSTAYSNNGTGIHVESSEAVIEDTVVNANKKHGLFLGIDKNLEVYNVNVSAHFFNFAVYVELRKSCRVGISGSHFHDNKMGAINFEGNFSRPEIIIHNSNFTRNTGQTLLFKNAANSTIVIEKCGFLSNNFHNFDQKDAVVDIDNFRGQRIAIQSCAFLKNAMHDIVRIHDSSTSITPIDIQFNKFSQNLANSIIYTNSMSAKLSGNQFGNLRASCEITFSLPRIPNNQDFHENVFGLRDGKSEKPSQSEKSICTGDYHPYQMDQPMPEGDETYESETAKYLENPFKNNVNRVEAVQTPYFINDEVYINAGETVSIEAGAILDFAPGVGITIHSKGRLILNGQEEKPVVLRGQNGNTWRGLVAKPDGALNMSHTVVEDASIGVWVDSEKVNIHGGRIVRPVVHGVEITHNSNDVVDLGGLVIEGTNEAAIGVDERRDDLMISNARIQDSSGSGIDFVTPTGNIEIRDVAIDNVGAYAIHISEFPSSPLHAVLMRNVSVSNQKKGQAGVLISGGWIQNIGMHNMTFSGNSVPSLIVALECNDENERLIRIENSNFTGNRDIVQHVQLGTCANLQMEKNLYDGNNDDGIGSTLVLTTDNGAVRKNGLMEISNNRFTNNSGTYTVTLESNGHSTFFTNNDLRDNQNSGAVLKISGENAKIITNTIDNKDSQYQISYTENAPLDLSFNNWNQLSLDRIGESIDAREGVVNIRLPAETAEQLDPLTTPIPVTVPYETNVKCAHLKYCSLRGTCREGICVCPLGFTGFDCSIPTFCNCSGHGLCDIFNKCLCNEGWGGPDCSTPKCPNNCNSHGKCVAPNQCECSPGWLGETCSTTSCIDANCQHGHCSDGLCKCQEGWKGSKCRVPICSNCTLNGKCVSPGQCKCFEDYGGADCSQCIGASCDACDFDCDHGACEPTTRTCSCSPGWGGGACDVCSFSKCSGTIGKISYIQPSTAELEDTNSVVNVYGADFSKTEGNSYVCTFGRTTVTGRRVSSSLLRCPIPANMTIGRHVFSVSQPGSLETIGTLEMRPIHFTIYDGCEPTLCQGSCVGPLCICPQGKTGVFCDVIEIIPTIDRRFLEHQRANRAFEGSPYVLMLPTMTSSVLRVNSSIPNLNFIASKGIIAWPEPIGSEDPYSISVTAYSPAGESTISWNVTVEPEYSAEVEHVTVTDEKAKISGRIVRNKEGSRISNGNDPVVLRIRRDGDNVVDEILAKADANGNINYDYVPMLPGSYEVSMSHPGEGRDPKTQKFQVGPINLKITGESTYEMLKIGVAGKDQCEAKLLEPIPRNQEGIKTGDSDLVLNFGANWTGEVLAWVRCDDGPMEIVRAPPVAKTSITTNPSKLAIYGNDRLYQVSVNLAEMENINLPLSVSVSNNALEFVSSIPNINDLTDKDQLLVLNFGVLQSQAGNGSIIVKDAENIVSTTPFVILPEEKTQNYITFKICARDEWDGQEGSLASSEVATIAISNTQKSVDIAKPNIRMNVQWAEFALLPGMYNIEVRSESHEPFRDVVVLDPLNTTFCIPLVSSRAKTLPTVHCNHFTDPGGSCNVEISSITGTDESLPYLKFEPSVITTNGQKVLVMPRGNQKGTIGLWNAEVDGFNITHSRRSMPINQSFWTTVSWGDSALAQLGGVGDKKCDVQLLTLPFVFLPEGSDIPIHSSSSILLRLKEGNRICEKDTPIKPATSTKIMCNCGDGARARCRERYRSATACGASWAKISDDTVSLEALVAFLSMTFECREVSVNFSEIKDSLECVASIESDCPISTRRRKRDNRRPSSEKEMQQDSPVRIVNHLSSVNMDLGKVLPVLNALDVQTIRISTVFIEFIDRMQKVFPPQIFEDLDRDVIDTFLEAIADQSEEGILVSSNEEMTMRGKGKELIQLWNRTVKSWSSGRFSRVEDHNDGISYQQARELVNAADRVKSISRQNVAQDPFSMLHGYMERILETGESEQRKCATSTVYIDETEVEEDAQLRIRVFIQNQLNASLTNIGVTLTFVKANPSTANLNFNVGPSWSAGIGSLTGLGSLNKDGSFEIHWTRFINSPRRLTTIARYQPIIIFAFSANGRQTQQKLFAPEITVIPKKTVKAINIIKDELSPKEDTDFSIISSIINPGYAALKNVQIYFDGLESEGGNPKLHEVVVNGKTAPLSLSPKFSEIQSGSTHLVKLVMKNEQGSITPLASANITCVESGKLLPLESTDTYAIRAAGPSDYGMLLAAPHQSAPLFYFRPSAAQMVNVIRLEFLSIQQSDSDSGSNGDLTYLAAFRNPESSSFGGALWARMPIPDVGANSELHTIIDRSEMRPRELQAVKWETEENGNPMLNWIDSGGSVQQKILTYELRFSNPKETPGTPMFEQPQYRIEIPPGSNSASDSGASIEIGQLVADGDDVTYSLYTPDNNPRFSVDSDSGKVYYTFDDTSLPKEEYCVVVEAKDIHGSVSRVPVAINNGGQRRECVIFGTDGLLPMIHIPMGIPTPQVFSTQNPPVTVPIFQWTTTRDLPPTSTMGWSTVTSSSEASSQPTPEPTSVTYPDSTMEAVTMLTTTSEITETSTSTTSVATEEYAKSTESSETTTTTTSSTAQIETTTEEIPEEMTSTTSELPSTWSSSKAAVTEESTSTTSGFTVTSSTDSSDSTDFLTLPTTTTFEPEVTETSYTVENLDTTTTTSTSITIATTAETTMIYWTPEVMTSMATDLPTSTYETLPDSTPSEIPETTTTELITEEITKILPTDPPTTTTSEPPATEATDVTEPTTYTITPDPSLPTLIPTTTTEMVYTVTQDASPDTEAPWVTPIYVSPDGGGDFSTTTTESRGSSATVAPYSFTTMSYETNEKLACEMDESHPIYKIVCDLSRIARPANKMRV